MDLTKLKIFYGVAKKGGIKAASSELKGRFITQRTDGLKEIDYGVSCNIIFLRPA